MKIIVFCKPVPKGVRNVRLVEGKGAVACDSNSFLMNECDEYALEAALLWKKERGAEVTAATMGGIRSQDALYLAMAKGADRALRIDADVNDSDAAARVLTEAVRGKGYDLILAGVESEDNNASRVGTTVAEGLGFPHAFAVTKVAFGPEEGKIRVVTELGGGVQEELEIRLPAVLSIQSGIAPLTYAAPAKIIRARKNPLDSMPLKETGLKLEQLEAERPRAVEVFEPPKSASAERITGTAEEIAGAILDKVKHALG